MARFFLLVLISMCLLPGFATPALAASVNNFVAVADGATGGIFNPAGLADLESNYLKWEHRFDGRDLILNNPDVIAIPEFYDDLAVFAATGKPGNGALFILYSQDSLGDNRYQKIKTYGYAYGWPYSGKISFGVSGKFSETSRYTDMVHMYQDSVTNNFLIDFGVMVKPAPGWQLGLALHNFGKDESVEFINYESALGISYRYQGLLFTGEINDLMNEATSQTILRLGCRLELSPALRIHVTAAGEETADDGILRSRTVSIEYLSKNNVITEVSWGIYPKISDNTLQASLGFKF